MFTWQSWEEGETGQGAAGSCTPSNPRSDHTSHGWKHTFTATSTDRWTNKHTQGLVSSTVGAQTGCCLPPRGESPTCLGSHNLARPCLVGGVGSQLGEHHFHSLKLLVLGWDGTHLVRHLISFHGHVLPLDAGGQNGKDQLDISPQVAPSLPKPRTRSQLSAVVF